MKQPLLTVCVITYNHAKYIRECIDSILMQDVHFTWEIVIADDCSTDGTREILQGYAKQYPELIRLLLQKKNVGAEQNWFDLLAVPASKYILYCEGDDYFIDRLKLQAQVDFMEKNPTYALCFHPVQVVFEDKSHKNYVYPSGGDSSVFTLNELLNQNYIQTNSAVYRRQDYTKIPRGIIPGDWYLHLMHAKTGSIGFIEKTMSVYRRHPGGTWWGAVNKQDDFWQKYATGHLLLYREIYKLFKGTEHFSEIDVSLARIIDMFISLPAKQPYIIQTIINDFPDLLDRYLKFQLSRYLRQSEELKASEKKATELYQAVTEHRMHIAHLNQELEQIHNSKSWKVVKIIKNGSGFKKILKRR